MNTYLLCAWKYLWAGPWTLVGLAMGLLTLAAGGEVRCCNGIVEFSAGLLPRILRRIPIPGGATAMTWGHVVIGTDRSALDRSRNHERIHVRQYERWGVLFVPMYLACSAWVWFRGRDPYRDNPFEIDAYSHSGEP